MGAAYYDDAPCIDCGLCLAKTREEMVEASKRIRDYMRSHAEKKGTSRKIAICGKGGIPGEDWNLDHQPPLSQPDCKFIDYERITRNRVVHHKCDAAQNKKL